MSPRPANAAQTKVKILAFGDSITAGYRLDRKLAFPTLLEELLKKDGYAAEVINAGISGDTTTQGLARVGWTLKHSPDVNVVLLELGANDGLRGLPIEDMKKNLASLIAEFRKAGIKSIILFGMKVTKNRDDKYREDFEKAFPTLAKKEKIYYLPFFLESVAFHPDLTLEDLIHPNEKGHQALAQELYSFLRKNSIITVNK